MTATQDDDYFPFEYSIDGQTWLTIFQIFLGASDSNSDLTYDLFSIPAGTLFLRVGDTNHAPGSTFVDTVTIDEMFVRTFP